MSGIDVEKVSSSGCAHTSGMVALSIGGAVCLTCFKEALQAVGAAGLRAVERAEKAEAERDRLAGDALTAERKWYESLQEMQKEILETREERVKMSAKWDLAIELMKSLGGVS